MPSAHLSILPCLCPLLSCNLFASFFFSCLNLALHSKLGLKKLLLLFLFSLDSLLLLFLMEAIDLFHIRIMDDHCDIQLAQNLLLFLFESLAYKLVVAVFDAPFLVDFLDYQQSLRTIPKTIEIGWMNHSELVELESC